MRITITCAATDAVRNKNQAVELASIIQQLFFSINELSCLPGDEIITLGQVLKP